MSVYFVDPVGGDDGNDGTSEKAPFKTIARAIPKLSAGDVLRLHAAATTSGRRPAARRPQPAWCSRPT